MTDICPAVRLAAPSRPSSSSYARREFARAVLQLEEILDHEWRFGVDFGWPDRDKGAEVNGLSAHSGSECWSAIYDARTS